MVHILYKICLNAQLCVYRWSKLNIKQTFPLLLTTFLLSGSRWNWNDYNKDWLCCFAPHPLLSLLVFSALILDFSSVLPWSVLSCPVSLLYTPCSIQCCWLIPSALLPRAAGCSLLSGVLRASLQPVVSAVCAQHRAVPSCRWPLQVPVWLLRISVQPRQVAFFVPLTFTCSFTYCLIHSRLSF